MYERLGRESHEPKRLNTHEPSHAYESNLRFSYA